MSSGTLFALPFDAESLQVGGTAMPVLASVDYSNDQGDGRFSVSPGGTPGELRQTESRFDDPAVSPDGKRVAFAVADDEGGLWIYDLARGVPTRITSAAAFLPSWSPDGRSLVYSGRVDGEAQLFVVAADGTGEPTRISPSPNRRQLWPDFSPDGRQIGFSQLGRTADANMDLAVLTLSSGVVGPLLQTEFHERLATLSPNGRWLAYLSDESGESEVYVRSYPDMGAKQRVSIGGGNRPRWAPDGSFLYYTRAQRITGVSVHRDGDQMRFGEPELVVDLVVSPDFDVLPDGRFVVIPRVSATASGDLDRVTLVLNWDEEVERLLTSGSESCGSSAS
ncbi:MAG: hypothetical protein VYE73_05540 [Acidobacteriota bacterium]|nr:hypothetical protein [Acidobacteriota bacterium]